MNQRPTRNCEGCGETQTFFSGISKKSGNPYAVWKCEACGKTDWNPTPKFSNQAQFVSKANRLEVRKEVDWDAVSEDKFLQREWTAAKISSKDILVAEINNGAKMDIETQRVLVESWARFLYSLKQPNDDSANPK